MRYSISLVWCQKLGKLVGGTKSLYAFISFDVLLIVVAITLPAVTTNTIIKTNISEKGYDHKCRFPIDIAIDHRNCRFSRTPPVHIRIRCKRVLRRDPKRRCQRLQRASSFCCELLFITQYHPKLNWTLTLNWSKAINRITDRESVYKVCLTKTCCALSYYFSITSIGRIANGSSDMFCFYRLSNRFLFVEQNIIEKNLLVKRKEYLRLFFPIEIWFYLFTDNILYTKIYIFQQNTLLSNTTRKKRGYIKRLCDCELNMT